MSSSATPRVAVLGGGFGGLEAAFYLRMRLHERADITLVSDSDRFLFKPNTIYIPFGLDPQRLYLDLRRPTRRRRIELIVDPVVDVEPTRKRVRTQHGSVKYDYLVVATGAATRSVEVPGLAEHANTIWTPAEMSRLGQQFAALAASGRAGQQQRVLFLIPPGNMCAGPLYEIAMMLDTWLRRQRLRQLVQLTWSTYEEGYVQAFGPRLHRLVEHEFGRRGIEGHLGVVVDHVEPGVVVYRSGLALPFDLLVSFPPYVAAVAYSGLPSDDRGFVPTDLATRQVVGQPDVFAVGDAGDFPVKQGFLALLQGDAVGEQLASRILGTEPQGCFEPTSMCVMEQLDAATFAQVPLRLSGRSLPPVEVRPDAQSQYLVGTSPVWRLGKKMLGVYAPWRFGGGKPFHAGLPWKGMQAGLSLGARLFATPP